MWCGGGGRFGRAEMCGGWSFLVYGGSVRWVGLGCVVMNKCGGWRWLVFGWKCVWVELPFVWVEMWVELGCVFVDMYGGWRWLVYG